MFNTIVVGTDGSQNALAAVKATAEIAAAGDGATVHVVNAYHPLSAAQVREVSASLPEELRPLLNANVGAESALSSARYALEGQGVHAQYHQVDEDPTSAVLDVAEHVGADLIVVGSRGLGRTGRLLHGSVSTKVIHHAPCTVLVVRDDG